MSEHLVGRLAGHAVGEAETELLVLVAGGDELVGVRLDADRHPDHDGGDDAQLAGDGIDPDDLVEGVQHDAADAIFESAPDFSAGFVVAVQGDSLTGEAGPGGYGEFAPGADVEVQALLGNPAGDLGAQEGLAGVIDIGAPGEAVGEGVPEGAGPGAEIGLIQHIGGRAEFACERDDVDAADDKAAGAVTAYGLGPQLRQQLHDVPRIGQPDGWPAIAFGVEGAGLVCAHGYILSGAETPSSPRPFARTTRVASLSQRRVRCRSVTGSSALSGRTRQVSYHLWKCAARSSR